MCSAAGLHAKELQIVLAADERCPMNCIPKSHTSGYVIEPAQHISGKQGYTVLDNRVRAT